MNWYLHAHGISAFKIALGDKDTVMEARRRIEMAVIAMLRELTICKWGVYVTLLAVRHCLSNTAVGSQQLAERHRRFNGNPTLGRYHRWRGLHRGPPLATATAASFFHSADVMLIRCIAVFVRPHGRGEDKHLCVKRQKNKNNNNVANLPSCCRKFLLPPSGPVKNFQWTCNSSGRLYC